MLTALSCQFVFLEEFNRLAIALQYIQHDSKTILHSSYRCDAGKLGMAEFTYHIRLSRGSVSRNMVNCFWG